MNAKKFLKENGYDPNDEIHKIKSGGVTTKLHNILESYATQSLPGQISDEEIEKGLNSVLKKLPQELTASLDEEAFFVAGFQECAKWANRTALPREGWISVQDRLPEKGDGEFNVVNQGTVHSALWDGSFYSVSAMGTHRHIDITHWQPLPHAP